MVIRSSPFGSQTRTAVLLAIRLLDESHPRELARLLDRPLNGVQQAIRTLERDGLIAGRTVGRSRIYCLDPRYFGREELQRYLLRLTEAEDELRSRVSGLRRRPRRSGKPL